MEIERRAFGTISLRARGEDAAAGPLIAGHAAVFNMLSEDLGGWREQIAPGTFGPAIQRDDVRALFNHDPNFVLGRNRAGTLRLSEDDTGLAFDIDPPPETNWVADLLRSIERGDISQCSFGFQTLRDSWSFEGQIPVRTLLEVRLFDVSPVTYPAYPQTDVGVRSVREALAAHGARYAAGDRVRIRNPHDPAHVTGTIIWVSGETPYEVLIDGMEAMGSHRWYTDSELDPLGAGGTDAPGAMRGGAPRAAAPHRPSSVTLRRRLQLAERL